MKIDFNLLELQPHPDISYPTGIRMHSMEWVKANCIYISHVLSQHVSVHDGDGAANSIDELVAIAGLIAETEAVAKSLYEKKSGEIARANHDKPATMLKYLIGGETNEELLYMTWAERLGRNWTHTMDGIRSLLSKIKAEIEKGL